MKQRTLLPLLALAPFLQAATCSTTPPNPSGSGGSLGLGGSSWAGEPATAGAPSSDGKCETALANFQRLGCPEDPASFLQLCATYRRPENQDRYRFDVDCRITATSTIEAQKCGVASCR